MRLEVFCEDRLGLTRELLDILATQHIDLRGIEIDTSGKIYLNCPEIEFEQFRELMAQIRRISGVTDVRKIQFMPSEREHTELRALLTTLPDPVFSFNLNGKVEIANHAALSLFNLSHEQMMEQSSSALLPHFNFSRWLEQSKARQKSNIVVNGLDYLMEVMPVYITDDSNTSVLASAVVLLKSVSEAKAMAPSLPDDSVHGFEHFVGSSNRHKQLISQAKKLAMLDQPLLIQGETGTGKEMLARACHNRSHRDGDFLVVNCASMPDDVAETELFGYAPGAFQNNEEGKKGIFEQADGGTVFLDEIGEMSPHLQIKVLRLLQDGTFRRVGEEKEIHVDVRVIGATQKDLSELINKGSFREDLYYRLNVLSLTIPPLRDRVSDIPALLDLFIAQFAQELKVMKPSVPEATIELLSQYVWPGNVRQLRNTILRAMTQLDGSTLDTSLIELPKADMAVAMPEANIDGSLDDIMKRYESGILENLYQTYPSTRKLAKRLNVSHTAIANKLREYSIGRR